MEIKREINQYVSDVTKTLIFNTIMKFKPKNDVLRPKDQNILMDSNKNIDYFCKNFRYTDSHKRKPNKESLEMEGNENVFNKKVKKY